MLFAARSPSVEQETFSSSDCSHYSLKVLLEFAVMDTLTSQLDNLSLGSSESLVAYLVGSNRTTACYFRSSSDKFFVCRSASIPESFEVGGLYSITRRLDGTVVFSELEERVSRTYLSRRRFAFTEVGYDRRVLPSLLLGCRLRDYAQTCAKVVNLLPLILITSSRSGFLKRVSFRAETGDLIDVVVDNVIREGEKSLKLFCTALSRLPSSLKKESRLQFCADNERIPIVTAALEHFAKSGRPFANWDLLNRIYGKPGASVHAQVEGPRIRVTTASGDIILNADQCEAVHRYQSDCAAFAVESPPGSGKTMTAAAMAVSYAGPGLQLFLSTANVPVFNMAIALAGIDYGDLKIVHLVSAEREAAQQEHECSPFSVLNKQDSALFREIAEQLPLASKREQREMRASMRCVHAAAHARAPIRYDVILGTVDMILVRLLRKKDPKRRCPIQTQLESRVRRIVVDEASQLTEASLNALVLCFPHAQLVLIGDSKQLPPFNYTRDESVSEMAACSALEVLKRGRNVPVITLRKVYRAAPSTMSHYSDVFYDGALESGKPESTSVNLTSVCKDITRRCAFIDVKGSKTERSGNSKINDKEIAALEYVVRRLRQAGYDHTSVMIISYYEAQRKLAAAHLPDGYEVLTVDSAQGREKDIVILLTTRDSPSDFFSCRLRCNVAMSRHKEALIVLGNEFLLKTEPWEQVLDKKYFEHLSYGK